MAKRKMTSAAEKKRPAPKIRQASRKYTLAEWFGFGNQPDPRWVRFSQRHAGNPALEHDSIYALPEPLIDAMEMEMPGFFSEKEQEFERDLARVSGGGFFLRHPFSYPPIYGAAQDHGTDGALHNLLQRWRKTDQQIKRMLVEDLKERGRNPLTIPNHFTAQGELVEKIEARKWGYAGWLVTNPDFRKEWTEVRQSWEPWIREIGGFPTYPTDFMGHSPVVPKAMREFYVSYTQFYQRWCIHTFATWDLPVPMWAGIATPIFYPLTQVSDAGMALFIPWYLLRDQAFKLQDLAKHERFAKGPDHLQGWFQRDRNKWGHERLGRILKVYFCVELCLKKRYPDRINRRTEGMNQCLGCYVFHRPSPKDMPTGKVESIKKDRQEMTRRLKM